MKKLFLVLTLLPAMLAALNCSECSKVIRSRYLKTDNGIYCSRRCFNKTLPKCEKCKKACTQGVRSMLGRNFCSTKCMSDTFKCEACKRGLTRVHILTTPSGKNLIYCNTCIKKEKCYYCMLPGAENRLDRQRMICRKCQKSAVSNPAETRRIFNSVRKYLAKEFNFDDKHKISLHIVDAPALEKIAGSTYSPPGAKKIAMMQFQQEITEEKSVLSNKAERRTVKEICRIFILDSTPESVLKDALVHELTHDHLRHNAGKVEDLASEEGFCELVAALYNEKNGNSILNKYKESNKDPVYGGGYRKMRAIYNRCRDLRRTMMSVK